MVIKKSARALHRLFWVVAVLVLFLVAIYVSLGRYYIDYVEEYQDSLVEQFVEFTGLKVEVGRLYGTWSHLYPSLTLEQVTLYHPTETDQQVLSMGKMTLTIDILSTLTTGALQANGFHVSELSSQVEEFEPGQWRLRGYPYQSGDSNVENIIDRILLFKAVSLDEVELEIFHADGNEGMVFLESFNLARSGEFRRAKLLLSIDQSLKPLSILIESHDDPRDVEEFSAEAYASFQSQDFSGQLPFLHTLGIQLSDARIDSELWGRWAPGGLITVEGELSIPLLDLAAIANRPLPDINNFSSRFKLERGPENHWQGWIANIHGELNNKQYAFQDLQFSYQGELLKVAAASLSIEAMVDALLQFDLLEGKGLGALQTLAPAGELSNMQLEVSTAPQAERLFLLRSNLSDVSIKPWHGSPGATGVAGYIIAEPSGGTVVLDSPQFTLDFPGIYHRILNLGQARAQVAWRIDETHVYVDSGPIDIRADHGPSTGLLRLDLPLDKAAGKPQMTLAIGLRDVDAAMRDRYIPYILSEDLLQWLGDSIQSGRILDAGFIYRGSLAATEAQERTVQLYLNVEDLTLDYHPDWPVVENVQGLVVINDLEIDVNAAHSTVSGLAVGTTTIEVDPLDKGSWLKVKAELGGSATDALRIVTESPGLRRIVGAAFDYWQLDGDISAEIQLGVPLGNDSLEPEINFTSKLSNSNVDISDFNLQLKDFAGPLAYSSESGFYSSGIKGSFFGEQATIVVSQPRGQPLNVNLGGRVAMKDVATWTGEPAMIFFSGKTAIEADITIGPEGSQMMLISDMTGVTIDLPAPYNKSADESWPFHLHMPIGEDTTLVTMSLADKAIMQLQLLGRGFESGLLVLGNTMDASHEPGLMTVTGYVPSADWDDWYPRYERYLEAAASASASESESEGEGKAKTGFKVRQLYLDHLKTFVDAYDDVVLDLTQQSEYWQLDVDTQKIRGRISIPVDSTAPWLYKLDKFVIATRETDAAPEVAVVGESLPAPESVFEDVDPATVQDADFSIEQLYLGEEHLGTVSFSMRSNAQGLKISELIGEIRTVTVGTAQRPGVLRWSQDEQGDHSKFNAVLRFKNAGDVFDRWGFDRAMESEKGKVIVDINWPAKPDEWTLEQSEGLYKLDIEDGRFLKTSGTASGALKVVSILNLNNIIRRLKLDFSDISKGGVSFDDLDGGFEIKDGYLVITDPLLIHSPSSQFLFSGATNIHTEQLEMEMIATLPVAGNLPWVAAAFLGGLPVAAGVFVATKLFQDQVDKVSSAVYTFEGTWDDPKLEFKKMYAGDLSKKKAKKPKKSKKDKADDSLPEQKSAAGKEPGS